MDQRDHATFEPEIRRARPLELAAATKVTVRAFRDSPMTLACWGADPHRRERGLRVLFGVFLQSMPTEPFIALLDQTVVGVLGMAPPGTCLHTPLGATLRVATSMVLRSPATANRFRRWMVEYERHDLAEAHWHLGPVAVDPSFQHQGIGSLMLQRFCALVDADGVAAYLETDEGANVRLYERFGFVEIGREEILGMTNWFMRRGVRL
jgi:ribosomal protein S18 acetylase RimI-like enzyme